LVLPHLHGRGARRRRRGYAPGLGGPLGVARTLYRGGALADGRSGELRHGVSILVDEGRIAWIRPADDEGETAAGRAAGPATLEAHDADELMRLANRQLDDGADFLKLYMDGPEPGVAPWSADEAGRVVAAVHARGARVTAHSSDLAGARVCVAAGVDSIEHGMELDADVARD